MCGRNRLDLSGDRNYLGFCVAVDNDFLVRGVEIDLVVVFGPRADCFFRYGSRLALL